MKVHDNENNPGGLPALRADPGGSSLPVLKRAFPFRLATTSYILPDAILPNVRFLAPFVDEVELVLFESGREENLPSRHEVREMAQVAEDLDLTYNVHLPADIFLLDPDPAVRDRARRTALRFYNRTLPLSPTVYVLHLDSRSADGNEDPETQSWLERVWGSMEALSRGVVDLSRVAVENLSYPLERIRPLVEEMGMTYCLDLGHMLRYGFDLWSGLESFLPHASMVHLHGVVNGVDHRGLELIDRQEWDIISRALRGYEGGVSLEVFALGDLRSSLQRMGELRP